MKRIEKKLDQIVKEFTEYVPQKSQYDPIGLYTGQGGILLFLLHYTQHHADTEVLQVTDLVLDNLVEQIAAQVQPHSYCNGLAGVLYLFKHLEEKNLLQIDLSETEELLDSYLYQCMANDVKTDFYDFLHGALGVGFYFLKANKRPDGVRLLINHLYETAEKDASGSMWKWKSLLDEKDSRRIYNISLSHGISAIILFLCRAIQQGFDDDRTKEMLHGAVNYILSQQIDYTLYGSHFPNYSNDDPALITEKSRLAWCYGDLGIAVALWNAGKTIRNKEWQQCALKIIKDSTARTTAEETGVIEAGICHGSCGVALIYRYFYRETGEDELAIAADGWLRESLDYAHFKDGLAGYKSLIIDKWCCDYSLLTGIAGTGLVFSSFLHDDTHLWDELFLLF